MKGLLLLWAVIVTLLAPGMAAAQGPAPGQSMLPGQNKDQPVQIEAASLEVHDKSKTATFSGNVQVVQGDTTMKCQSLVVFYGREVGIAQNEPKQASIAPGPKGAQDIRKIEAHGGVTVVTKDQNATGDDAIYDLQSKTIKLIGNVIVSQGQNVIHGESVVVDTVTGNARVESSEGGGTVPGRVRALIQPNQKGQNGGAGNLMTIGPGRPN
ncbi:MAG: lipopolysaccharide transport periplasmic protein LptA [Xanthobacteraceae bacterium]|jgi:lipopolysaccharide export system protein LptA